MAFPASVNTVPLNRVRVGRPTKPERHRPNDSENINDEAAPGVTGSGGPVLDFGREGAARLERRGGRHSEWKWFWIGPAGEAQEPHIQVSDEPKLMYTGTKLVINLPKLPRHVVRESAKDYLVSIGDDVDASVHEIVDHEIVEAYRDRNRRDVYQGHTLAIIHNRKATIARNLICHPTGLAGNHLNISPLLPPTNAVVFGTSVSRFTPSAKPAYRFPTEILQLCSSPVVQKRLHRNATLLLVRLHSSTELLKVVPNPKYVPPTDEPAAFLEHVATLRSADTGDLRHVDAALDPTTWGRAVIIDERGGVWLWCMKKLETKQGTKDVSRVKIIRGPVTEGRDNFFRIAFGTRPDTVVVLSRKEMILFDLLDEKTEPVLLLHLQGQRREFTSLEKTATERRSAICAVCTTHEVMWIDESRPSTPVLSWTHEFGSGKIRDMELTTIGIQDREEFMLLSSRSHPLVLAFQVSSHSPVRSPMRPVCLAISLPTDQMPLSSLACTTLSRYRRGNSTDTLLGLAPNGSLWAARLFSPHESISKSTRRDGKKTKLVPARDEARESSDSTYETSVNRLAAASRTDRSLRSRDAGGGNKSYAEPQISEASESDVRSDEDWSSQVVTQLKVEWDEDMLALVKESGEDGAEAPLETMGKGRRGTRYRVFGARWAWFEINKQPTDDEQGFSSEDLVQHLRELDAPFEHLMTLGDLARDLVRYPGNQCRSHLLKPLATSVSVNSELNALRRIDISHHVSIITEEQQIPIDLPALRRVFLYPRADSDSRRTKFDRLVLDLTLARTVVTTEPVTLIPTPSDNLETADEAVLRATGRLTLNEDALPAVEFAYLAPSARETFEEGSEADDPSDPAGVQTFMDQLQGPTLQALMSEWIPASDPGQYVWTPWRDSTVSVEAEASSTRPVKPLPSPRTISQVRSITQIAPRLHAMDHGNGLRPIPNFVSVPEVRSSPPASPSLPTQPQFQAQTQVERGPFGARVPQTKKKGKRRVGGF